MQIDRLETHDRLKEFTSKEFEIGECCQDLINQRPFGKHPFYIFSHARTIDLDERIVMFNADIQRSYCNPAYIRKYIVLEDVPTTKILWQPRLTKPKAQTNSMLYKAYPLTDMVKVIWIIPPRELWGQYGKGKLTENESVSISIDNFQNHRNELEAPEDDDLSDGEIDAIYREMAQTARHNKMMAKLWKKPIISL